jgi:ABC transport system ATP-binding/permease protein
MQSPILHVKEGCLALPNQKLADKIELHIYKGNKVALIGSNGSGKSTLLKLLSGAYELDSGDLFLAPNVKVASLQQDIHINSDKTAIEFVSCSSTASHVAENYLRQLSLPFGQAVSKMSGGQKRRTLLASVLAQEADIYLLDEPTNHLDIEGIEWLEQWINTSKSSFVIVSHDRRFLLETSQKTWWLNKAKLHKLDAGFKDFEQWQEEIIEEEERALRKLNQKLESETMWLHQGISARRRRNQGRLQELQALRQKVRDAVEGGRKLTTEIRSEKEVNKAKFILEAEDIAFKVNGEELVKNFSYRILKGERIGIIGPNGSGKTTLLKVLIKEMEPCRGLVKHGEKLKVAYFEQDALLGDSKETVCSFLQPSGNQHIKVGEKLMHAGAYIKQFGLDPKTLHTSLTTLSGGQINRLRLAKILAEESNLLVLDEPTNDLDMDASEALLEALCRYGGTALVVSHDRDFLDQFATRTISVSKSGIGSAIGGYSELRRELVTKKQKDYKPLKERRNLPYNLKRRLDMLPSEISALESSILKLKQRLELPELYIKEKKEELDLLSATLEAQERELEEKMGEWIEIEDIKDKLGK